jgi:hypothetical protein
MVGSWGSVGSNPVCARLSGDAWLGQLRSTMRPTCHGCRGYPWGAVLGGVLGKIEPRRHMLPAMRKVLLLLICAAVLWVPAASVAGDSSRSSASKPAKTEPGQSKGHTSSPAKACISQISGRKSHGAGANAFGKCVSKIAMHKAESEGKDSAESQDKDSAESQDKDSAESQHKNSANPAMTCKAMQANDLSQFQTAFGTRPNAFGKCVAKQANSKQG